MSHRLRDLFFSISAASRFATSTKQLATNPNAQGTIRYHTTQLKEKEEKELEISFTMPPKKKDLEPKTPSKTSKRKDAPTTNVSPPSKKGRLKKDGEVGTKGSKVKTPAAPKCQPGGMLLNWPPDPPKMSTTVIGTSDGEESGVAVESEARMINGSPPSSPEALKEGVGTSALLTELAELNLDAPKAPEKPDRGRPMESIPRAGAGKGATNVQKSKPRTRRDVKIIPSSDAESPSTVSPTQEGPSNTPVSTTPKKPSVKRPAPRTSRAKSKNGNPEAPPAEATPAQEDAPLSFPQQKPRPKKAATGARKVKGKSDNIPRPSVAAPGLPITPNQSFNGTLVSTNEDATPKQKLSEAHKSKNSNSKVAEVPVAAPLVPVVYKNKKPFRRIQPTPVTGNTPPPSPKSRPTQPAHPTPAASQRQTSEKEAGTQAESLSVLVILKAPRVYKSPYAPIPRNPIPVAKPVQENAIAPRLPTPPAPQPKQEEQDVSSQASSSQDSSLQDSSSQISVSQVPSSRFSSFKPYRRKALPPTHLPGGLGTRIRDKPFPKGISKPTAQQIINIITPGVQRRAWGTPARIPDDKALEMIEEIFQAKALEGVSVYDILRLPIYRSWEQHRGNYDKLVQCLQEEMAGGGRVVLGVKCK